MEKIRTNLEDQLPSFSLILETENLENANLQGLSKSLASLANQDIPPTRATEVLLIDSGDTPADLLERLCQQYPWIDVRQAPQATSYYKVKMLGAQLATGDIVIYSDSDCIYEPTWLRNLLTPFIQDDTIKVVAGETTTRGDGVYGTAMALTYIFPQYSAEKNLAETSQYFLNNVAFRREFLLKHPIPAELSLYRGNCVIHAHHLRQQGYSIWRQPQARATHAPPAGLSHFFWRFLLIGYDYYWQKHLLTSKTSPSPDPMFGVKGKLEIFRERLGKLVTRQPYRVLHLPLAGAIAIAAALLIFAGYLITTYKPNYLKSEK